MPAGIALSIVAEMQAVLAERSAGQLRFRTAPIYSTSLQNPPANAEAFCSIRFEKGFRNTLF